MISRKNSTTDCYQLLEIRRAGSGPEEDNLPLCTEPRIYLGPKYYTVFSVYVKSAGEEMFKRSLSV